MFSPLHPLAELRQILIGDKLLLQKNAQTWRSRILLPPLMILNNIAKRLITGFATAFALAVCTSAGAGVSWSVGINMLPAAPVYYEPLPTHVLPAPAYPAPLVVLRPVPPIYFRPATEYLPPVVRIQHNTYRSDYYHGYRYDYDYDYDYDSQWNDDD